MYAADKARSLTEDWGTKMHSSSFRKLSPAWTTSMSWVGGEHWFKLLQYMLYFPWQGSNIVQNVQRVHYIHWHFSSNEGSAFKVSLPIISTYWAFADVTERPWSTWRCLQHVFGGASQQCCNLLCSSTKGSSVYRTRLALVWSKTSPKHTYCGCWVLGANQISLKTCFYFNTGPWHESWQVSLPV